MIEAGYLAEQVNKGLVARFPDGVPEEHRVRADYELAIIDQMGYCFPPGTEVSMADGSLRPIERIGVGELIRTRCGAEPIGKVMSRNVNEELVELRVAGSYRRLQGTGNHPILTPHGFRGMGALRPGDEVAIDVQTEHSVDPFDLIGLARTYGWSIREQCDENRDGFVRMGPGRYGVDRVKKGWAPQKVEPTESVMYLMGLWGAQGNLTNPEATENPGRVFWTMHVDDWEVHARLTTALKVAGFGEPRIYDQAPKKAVTYAVTNHPLSLLLRDQIGCGARSKRLGSWLTSLPAESLSSFMAGWLDGDGYIDKKRPGRAVIVTANKTLSFQLRQILLTMGLWATETSYTQTSPLPREVVDRKNPGRIYRITWQMTRGEKKKPHNARWDGSRWWVKVLDVVREMYCGPVYNLSVLGDPTYIAEGIRVHNCSYFLVVADIVRYAKSQNIRIGPGRGSAAGSCVSYALGITQLDPLEHSLIFERFLNPERPSFPDIDLDFDERRRGEMIQYVTDKYGKDHVAQIVTFSTIKTRAAIKDAARVLYDKPGYELADQIIRALPPVVMAADIPLSGIFDPSHPRYAEAGEVRALVESNPQIAEIMEVARGLEGLKRQWGVHASGIVICAEPLIDHIPIMKRESDGATITQLPMDDCEKLGLVKMDFLGLRNLTIMSDCLRDIAATGQQPPDLDNLPMDDAATFDLLSRGDTLGVFQLDGSGMRDLLRRMQPRCLADIAAAAALYRPGPMGSGSHVAYVERKAGRQEIASIHPELAEPLADILGETYGLVVFQEQVLAIVRRVAGYSLGRADVLRRAMGKKKRDVLTREYDPFAAGMAANGYSIEAIETLWNVFLPCADYLFVKSHATGYAVIAYQGAYLKAHYPVQYMAALLTSTGGDKKDGEKSGKEGRLGIYLAECRRMDIRVTAPDVNESEGPFTARDGRIRFGLAAIRDVGTEVVEAIVIGRMGSRYQDWRDFLRKVDTTKLNSKALVSLIRAGAFDSLGHPRRGLEDICGDALAAAVKVQRAEGAGLFSLFGDDEASVTDTKIPAREWSTRKLLELERETLGLYVSRHPLDGAEHILAAGTPIASILDGSVPVDGKVTVGGIVSSVERKTSKVGNLRLVVKLEDYAASVEVVCFTRIVDEFGPLLKRDTVVLVTGRVSSRDGERPSVIADRVVAPDLTAPMTVALPMEQYSRGLASYLRAILGRPIGDLRKILERHTGDRVVRVKLLVRPGHTPLVELDERFRVAPGATLVAELTELLGDGCLTV